MVIVCGYIPVEPMVQRYPKGRDEYRSFEISDYLDLGKTFTSEVKGTPVAGIRVSLPFYCPLVRTMELRVASVVIK
jgi:hypothetical protein